MLDSRQIDLHVARRIAERRASLGVTQRDAAAVIGVSPVSYAKYESAEQRLTFLRLLDVARAFNVPISFFYDELPRPEPLSVTALRFESIPDDVLRQILLRLAQRLGQVDHG